MSNVSDLTLEVLKDIRADIRELRAEQRETNQRLGDTNQRLDGTNQRLDTLQRETNERLDTLTEATRIGFSGVNQRIDSVLRIVGTHHTELESRVKRLEDHLKLPHEQ